MKVLTIIDLQKDFDEFQRRDTVLKTVVDLIKNGGYDKIVNLTYQDSGPTLAPINRALKTHKHVIRTEKNEDGGGWNVLASLGGFIKRKGPKVLKSLQVDVVGCNTSFCVKQTVLDMVGYGLKGSKIRVIKKATTHPAGHNGYTARTFKTFKAKRIKVV